MCLKVCFGVAFYFVCLFTLSHGFFLPVFVRKQHPQTPAVNSPQWTSYQQTGSSSGGGGGVGTGGLNLNLNGIAGSSNANPQVAASTTYKEYNPFQQGQSVVTPLHQVHVSPLQTQYSYESGAPPYLGPGAPYPQYHSAFHSVQLVPCLCPISKDVIEQQSQQYQHPQQVSSSSSASPSAPIESGANEVLIKGSQKVNS